MRVTGRRRRRTGVWFVIAVALCAVVVGFWALRRHDGGKVVVCIDPGHPSESNSARTVQNGTTELEMNWAVANRLKALLSKDDRLKVILTRERMDQYMRNSKRATVANEAHAAIAVHLHCDTGGGEGFTVYYPDRVAHAEGRRGPSAKVMRSSRVAAEAVDAELVNGVGDRLGDRGVRGDSQTYYGRKTGGLTTSTWSEVPTVTVEMVFLDNRRDAALIKSERGQDEIAAALAAGITRFIGPKLPHRSSNASHRD